VSCNVYADTGFKQPELWLQKADIVIEMRQAMKARRLTPSRAARIVRMPSKVTSATSKCQHSSIACGVSDTTSRFTSIHCPKTPRSRAPSPSRHDHYRRPPDKQRLLTAGFKCGAELADGLAHLGVRVCAGLVRKFNQRQQCKAEVVIAHRDQLRR
jgi:hypothetical protein